ncbi:MAG: putative lipid II flippase FtsW [Ruminococcaceae bacterium]|nr:putative lipid II flippase FtsW [Oscillospiraceae bacterium]
MQNTGNRNAYGQNRARRYPENINRTHRPAPVSRTASSQSVPGSRSVPRSLQYGSAVQKSSARPAGTQTGTKRTPVRQEDYRFTAQRAQQRPPARQGRPVTSNRTDAGRRPRVDPGEAERRRKLAEKEARKARKKAAQTTAVAAYKERHMERVNKKEEAWQKDIVRVRGGVDKVMLGLILTLVCLGTIMVFSASYPSALNEGLDMHYYSKRQLAFVFAGLIVMFIASRVPYTWYKYWGVFVFYGIAIVLLCLVLVMGASEGEAKRWLYIGPFSMQPSEIMKVALVMIVAWYVDKFKPQIDARLNWKQTLAYNVIGPGVFIGVACILILLEKHLSGTAITGILGVAVMLVGGCHFGWTMLCMGSAGLAAAAIFVAINPYALRRLTTFTDENADKLDELYQTTQGLYAIGSGGLFGVGLGHSRQKYSFVSAAHTDFIFSIWCEELGFLGAVFLIVLFIAFVVRGYTIASRAPDTFSSLVAYGISTHVGLQALMNICVVADIIPNTGVSLPFFSYGGSSLIVLLGEMGILLSISRQYYMKRKDLEEKQRMDAFEFELE